MSREDYEKYFKGKSGFQIFVDDFTEKIPENLMDEYHGYKDTDKFMEHMENLYK